MKKLITLLCFCICTSSLFSQSNEYNIKGIVYDTLDNSLISATALLLEKSDSTLVDFTRTEIDGSFKFKNVKPGEHIVKFTYVGYLPITVDATSLDGADVDLGRIEMQEIAEELMEVVIKAARASMKMRGDTIEYDASTFQVPEGSSVEDLLKRLPGIEVEQDGSILADGKNVSRVTVDGKNFFGSDPKVATQNLPAESISKVQVFDTKTEEDKIAGKTGESEDKTMNLDLKDEFKKGGFGKVIAGVGTENTAEAKGNYNKFNNKIQFSLVGVANNTGRNGLNWDDYQDFMGSNSWNFGEDADYGFGGGRGFYTISFGGGDDDDIESSIQNIFFSGGNGGGFPKNYNGGFNFNYDHNKTKLSSVYYYNQSELFSESTSNRKSFFEDFTTDNQNVNTNDKRSRGHRAEMSFEKELDSLHSIVISTDAAIIDQTNTSFGSTDLSRNGTLTTSSDFDNTLDTEGYLINSQVIFRKKFMKKGRRMGVNGTIQQTKLERNGNQDGSFEFYNALGEVDSVTNVNQTTINDATKTLFKGNALYVEPLSKKFFLQNFYNFSQRLEDGDRDVNDIEGSSSTLNPLLSRIYDNTVTKNRIGSSLRFSHNGTNISVGVAYQAFKLLGDYKAKGVDITGTVDKDYTNWIPNVSFSMSPKRNAYLTLGYSVSVDEPSIANLRPIVDNANPLFLREGNPDLVPTVSKSISMSYRMNFPASSMRFNISGSYNMFTDQIINETTIDDNLVTYTRPINYTGGDRFTMWSSFNFPIKRNKLTVRANLSANASKSFAFVNDALNKTNTIGLRPSIRLNITPIENLAVYVNASWNNVNTKYDINTSEDQTTLNSNYNIEASAKVFAGIYLNSDFSYSIYKNDRFNVDQDVPVLNLSIYRHFLPKKVLEARISLYDGFNRNLQFNQSAFGNSVSESQTLALGRYVMFSMAYNIRGMKGGVRKDGWW